MALGRRTVVNIAFLSITIVIIYVSRQAELGMVLLKWRKVRVPEAFEYKNVTCRKLGFADPPLPTTYLISYPGSGNTWFRHLLQTASGIYTGSFFCDDVLEKNGFPGDSHWKGGRVIAIKVHDSVNVLMWQPKARGKPEFDRVILLMRDPIKAGKAEFNRMQNSNHTSYADADRLRKGLSKFLNGELGLPQWNDTYTSWLVITKPVLLVEYENLIKNLKPEMKRVFLFLKFNVTDDDLECMEKYQEGNFHRKKQRVDESLTVSLDYVRRRNEAVALVRKMYSERPGSIPPIS